MLKDYKGARAIERDGLTSYFFNYNELYKVLDAVKQERKSKIEKYGIDKYTSYMKTQAQTDLYTRFSEVNGEK